MTPITKTVTLSNGVIMPLMGIGTIELSSYEAYSAVKTAIQAGYRLIDTAAIYENEAGIGRAIKECIESGVVTREEIFVVTKAWVTQFGSTQLVSDLEASLKRLQLDYIDLYLASFPMHISTKPTKGSGRSLTSDWCEFSDVYRNGKAKAVGVSNWNTEQIQACSSPPEENPEEWSPIHVSQVECHLHFAQQEHVDYCKSKNIAVMGYAPLGSPECSKYALPFQKPITRLTETVDLENPVVLALAEKHHATPAQVLLCHGIKRGIAVIPKSRKYYHIESNIKAFDVPLSAEDMDQLDAVEQNPRLFIYDFMRGYYEDPFFTERPENRRG